jgi:hypothetical protein
MEPKDHLSPVRAAAPNERGYREHRINRGPHHLYAREYPGQSQPSS